MSQRTLVLNATYEPLTAVRLQRAVALVLAERAEIITETGDVVRSEHQSLPVPKVIRLLKYVRIPYKRRVPVTRKAVMKRDDSTCGYCGKFGNTIDHVKPRHQGGKHIWTNVVCACRGCNGRKRNRTPEEAGMPLRIKPFEPAGITAIWVAITPIDEAWEPYLQTA